jgi:hypothetical protein
MTMLEEELDEALQLFPPFFVLSCGGLALDKLVDPVDEIDAIEQITTFLG